MPPKKKGKGKGKKGKKRKTVLGGIPAEAMSTEKLLEFNKHLREEVEREREERNYFQLERDKINTFWEITKRQLEEAKAEIRNKERQMEDAEEKHQIEIRVYKQKVRHLLYEHQNHISELKTENTVTLKFAQDSNNLSQLGLRKDKQQLKLDLKLKELSKEQVIKELKKKNDDHITSIKRTHERQLIEIENKYTEKMRIMREELLLRHKTNVHEIEERKNEQISVLIKNHEKAFSDVKNYYNDVSLNNIALIYTLKEKMEEMQIKEDRMAKDMKELIDENKRLVDPLTKTQKKMADLRLKLADYIKSKEILKSTKARLKVMSEELQSLKWENEVLEQRFMKMQAERDELYSKFLKAIQEVQQKSNLKNLLLEKKLSALAETLEKKEVQLNEVLSVSNIDPRILSLVTRKLEDVLNSKNMAIKDLQYELARVCKAHNDLFSACNSKLRKFGIPTDNLGFRPLQSSIGGQMLGSGPAGLVSASTQLENIST